jgi:hypothetical protein
MLLSEMTRLDLFATMVTAYTVGRFAYDGWVYILTGVLLVVEDRLWLYNLGKGR